MNDFIFVNLGNGTVGLYEKKATFNGEQLVTLRDMINQLLDQPATDTRESRIPEEDSLNTSPDPAGSPQEDE